MSPIAWFVAGGITALLVARWFSRLIFRHWWLILAAVFLGAVYLVTGEGAHPEEWLAIASRLFAL